MTSRHPWGRCLRWVGAAGVAAGALAVIAGKPQPAVDVDEYQAIMADEAGAPAVLQQRFEEQRWLSLPLLPPGPEISLTLPLGGRVVPFDWKRFPKEFVAGLEGRWENSVPVYDLTLAEDPLTHETLFFNAAGEPILRFPAPVWSDPADLRLTLASLYGVVPGSADAALFDARLWDPARLQARLTLIRPEDVEYYLYAEARIRDYAATLESAIPPPVMMLMGGESEFCIAAVQRATNGIRLEIELPDGFTNRVDVFGSTNLVAFEWSVLGDGLSTTGGSPLVWTDSPLPATLRFYAAGDADTDSDLDGLTDAREVFLHRTCPTNLDTDADGLVDGNSGVVGTNLYAAGVQSNGCVLGELSLGTSQILADSDDDGVNDGAEVAGGTDPLDPNLPPNVRGTVFYTGLQTGTVRVIAVAVSGSWSTARQAALPAPGAYRIADLPPSNYWIRAFVDSNGDGTNDAPEACGEWAEGAVLVTNRVTDIDFTLADPDDDADGLPDWWEILHWSDTDTEDGEGDPDLDGYLNWEEYLARTDPEDDASHPFNVEGTVTYSGPLEGSIVVLASTSAASWAAAGSVTVSATGTFAILHLPVGASYWVKAFRDSDEDGVFDFGEAWGEDATEYVLDEPVTNAAVALVDHDADGDDLADWFEVAYGLDPQTGSNSYVCGWWKMNGSGAETNVVDFSGNTNDGWLVSAAATNWGEGVLHGALALTGSNYVQLVDDETLAPEGLTLALWINPAVDLTNGAAVLFSKKDPAAALGYSLAVTNGRVEWIVCQAGVRVLTAAAALTSGAWRHVAATYGAGRQRVYVDGVQAGETNWSLGTSMGYLDQGTTAPRIGASTDTTPARFFPGLVDDVRLYDGEFTSNEVWSIYEAGADLDGDTLRPAAEMAAGSSPSSGDTDGDGLDDEDECAIGTNPGSPDMDGDGILDGDEVAGGTNPCSADTDSDGITDYEEIFTYFGYLDPTEADTDGDGLSDYAEIFTTRTYAAPECSGAQDTDGDGLSDAEEVVNYGTNPWSVDSDGDGIDDGYEVDKGWDPTDAATATQNPDGDAFNNLIEYQWDYQPTVSNSAPPTSQKLILCPHGSNGVQHSDWYMLAPGSLGSHSARIRVRPFYKSGQLAAQYLYHTQSPGFSINGTAASSMASPIEVPASSTAIEYTITSDASARGTNLYFRLTNPDEPSETKDTARCYFPEIEEVTFWGPGDANYVDVGYGQTNTLWIGAPADTNNCRVRMRPIQGPPDNYGISYFHWTDWVRVKVTGSGANPTAATLNALDWQSAYGVWYDDVMTRGIHLAPGSYTFEVGYDMNGSGVLDAGEVHETCKVNLLKVDIQRDGTSIAWSTNAVNVGERIALTGTLDPALTVSSNLWSIPGTRIKSYTMSENLGETNGLSPSDLLATNVVFYWIDDGTTLQVEYTVFAEGITCSASTWFNVIRPTAALLSVTTTNSPAVNVSTNYWSGQETNHWMHFGNEASPGISWTGLVATAAGASGEIGFVQLIQEEGRCAESDGTVWVLSSSNQFVLDGTPPLVLYDDGPEAHKSIGASDAQYIDSNDTPGINLDSPEYEFVNADVSNNFNVYLMYRPSGIDSIWVTLRKMDWYWHGAVTNNGGWSMLPGASSSSSPSGIDSIELPTWKNHAVNINYEEE